MCCKTKDVQKRIKMKQIRKAAISLRALQERERLQAAVDQWADELSSWESLEKLDMVLERLLRESMKLESKIHLDS